ncbi:MAG TPA: VanW family protein [Actinomycetota bacterium]|nr:VanW family protein [Actinomycetota bacterium]
MGDKVTLQPSQNGSTIDTRPAAAALVALGSGDRKPIALPSVVQPAELTTEAASKLGIKQRISQYTTVFDSRNAPRVGNIDRMASAMDGKVIKPGEVFSLNTATGERTVANGYQEAGVLVDGELVPGIGGGVCQVATTLFNSVFSAGLDVVERSNHSLFVSAYPTGKDAMVNFGTQDLRFKNDTEYGLLLRARVSARELTVSIYSSPLGRTVSETTSPQTNPRVPQVKYIDDPTLPKGAEVVSAEGKPGFDVTVTRKVMAGGKVLHSDNFVSKYRPWKRVIKRGTGPAAAPAAPAPGPSPEPSATPAAQPTPSPTPNA